MRIAWHRAIPALVVVAVVVGTASAGFARQSPPQTPARLATWPPRGIGPRAPGAPLTYRLPDKSKVGLPPHAKVNATMFSGLTLTPAQGDSIASLSLRFAEERLGVLATYASGTAPNAVWDAAARQQILPFLERQRAAYRAVLTVEQRVRFDTNADRILAAWRKHRPQVGTQTSSTGGTQ
jgi:hypothetical protein